MTQTRFKPAAELNITNEERAAFIRLMEHFRTPAAPPTVPPERALSYLDFIRSPDMVNPTAEIRLGFNMAAVAQALELPGYNCGAVLCIGGHMSLMLEGVDVTEVATVLMTPEMMTRAGEYVTAPPTARPRSSCSIRPRRMSARAPGRGSRR
ncbi:hypothetical protein ACFQWF_01620 [Methylorubrum suomiense]